MTYLYKLILWTSIAAALGPIAAIAWIVWEFGRVPDMFGESASIEQVSA
jgi:hypothetical protein